MGPNRHPKATNDAESGLAYLPVLQKRAVQVALHGEANEGRDTSTVLSQILFLVVKGVEVFCFY